MVILVVAKQLFLVLQLVCQLRLSFFFNLDFELFIVLFLCHEIVSEQLYELPTTCWTVALSFEFKYVFIHSS